jgi:RNA polymerase sigma-70 factor (ECF subfamily)
MLDNATFSNLYNALAPKMNRWLTANGLEAHLAQELVQETFLRVWRKQIMHEQTDASEALLWTVLRNLRIDYFRRQRTSVSFQAPEGEHLLNLPAQPQTCTVDEPYLQSRIQEALTHLSPEIQTTFRLFFIDECSIKEIANRTHVTESLVKVRIHRARCRLQKHLSDLSPKQFN